MLLDPTVLHLQQIGMRSATLAISTCKANVLKFFKCSYCTLNWLYRADLKLSGCQNSQLCLTAACRVMNRNSLSSLPARKISAMMVPALNASVHRHTRICDRDTSMAATALATTARLCLTQPRCPTFINQMQRTTLSHGNAKAHD